MKAKFKKWDIVEVKSSNAALAVGVAGKGEIVGEPIEYLGAICYEVKFSCKHEAIKVVERYLRLVKRPFFGGLFRRRK